MNKSAGGGAWGSISGTLANQIDLNNALGAKVNVNGSKVLSDNNYTTAEKNKLADLISGDGWFTKVLNSNVIISTTSLTEITALTFDSTEMLNLLGNSPEEYIAEGVIWIDNNNKSGQGFIANLENGSGNASALLWENVGNIMQLTKGIYSNFQPYFNHTSPIREGSLIRYDMTCNSYSKLELSVSQKYATADPVYVRKGSFLKIKKRGA